MKSYKNSVRVAQLLAKMVMQDLSQNEKEELSLLLKKTGINSDRIIRNFSYNNESDYKESGKQVWKRVEANISVPSYSFSRAFMRYAAVIAFLLILSISGYYIFKKAGYSDPSIYLIENTTVLELPTGRQITLPESADISNLLHSAAVAENIGDAEYTDIFKVKVSSGSTQTLYLSDSTKVTLYPLSELHFPAVFDPSERSVTLKGEAYFQVKKETSRAFKVNMGSDSVVVLGTSFNIRAYENETTIETSLVSGKVAVNNTIIVPDQMAVIHRKDRRLVVMDIDASVYRDRASGMFVFENKSMDEIMREFSLWYGLEYEFANDELRDKRFRFRLPRSNSFNYLIKLMEETGELRFEFAKSKVKILSGKK